MRLLIRMLFYMELFDSGQEVIPLNKGKEEEITRREITPSPHEDGYLWKKYGQKNIQNKSFPR